MNVAAIVIALLPMAMLASPPAYSLTEISVHDGDTIRADIHLGFGVVLDNERIRLTGFDAWEINRIRRTVTITEAELTKGQAAKEALLTLLKMGSPELVQAAANRGAYGRIEGRLIIVTRSRVIDVAKWMKEHGHER